MTYVSSLGVVPEYTRNGQRLARLETECLPAATPVLIVANAVSGSKGSPIFDFLAEFCLDAPRRIKHDQIHGNFPS